MSDAFLPCRCQRQHICHSFCLQGGNQGWIWVGSVSQSNRYRNSQLFLHEALNVLLPAKTTKVSVIRFITKSVTHNAYLCGHWDYSQQKDITSWLDQVNNLLVSWSFDAGTIPIENKFGIESFQLPTSYIVQNLHFKDSVSFKDACFVCCSTFENGADMLEWSIELTVDWAKLSALTHLAAHIESEARFRFDNLDNTRAGCCHGRFGHVAVVFKRFTTILLMDVGHVCLYPFCFFFLF